MPTGIALGMDLDDIVQGEVPVEALLFWTEGGQATTRVRIDLTKSELTFEPIAWRKAAGPHGRPAVRTRARARHWGCAAHRTAECPHRR